MAHHLELRRPFLSSHYPANSFLRSSGRLLSHMFAVLSLTRPCLLACLVSTSVSKAYAAVIASADARLDSKLKTSDISLSNSSVTIVSASTPPSINWPLDDPAPVPVPGSDATVLNTSTLAAPQLSCNGSLYRRDINLASCVEAYHKITSYTSPRSFGERGTGDYDAPLPYRYLSRDGLCAIDIAHASGIESDVIAPIDLKQAAEIIIRVCVSGKPSEGGLLTGLGMNKGLSMRVVPYIPNVSCGPDASGPPWISCREVLDTMPANNKRQVFGPKIDEKTTVALPWSYTTMYRRCGIILDGVVPERVSDTGDWYKIWAAANALDFMCSQRGRNGVARGLGKPVFSAYARFNR